MTRWDVKTPADALAYITDCTLATVCDLAMKKSRPKYEYQRQQEIAQRAMDWMDAMGIDDSGTRATDVKAAGSVRLWAQGFEP